MAIGKGFETVAAVKHNGNTWGSGLPVACGAGDGVEILSDSLTADVELIENMGLSGKAQQLPGVKGNEFHSGDIPMDFYYQGCEVIIAHCLGTAVSPAQQGGTAAYLHVYKPADNHEGIFVTLVIDAPVAVREYPFAKVSKIVADWENGKAGLLTASFVPFGLNLNIGSPVTNNIVASVTPANGAQILAAQPSNPSPLAVLITDANASITEYVLTFIGTDRDGKVITETYTLSVNGLTWTTSNYFATVVSITGSGLAGSAVGDTLVVGTTNGVNNATTIANVTLPSSREKVLFAHCEVLINDQSAGALSASDEFFVSRFRVEIDTQMATDDVTTKFKNKIDEPVKDGFIMCTGGLAFSKWTTENHPLFRDYLKKSVKKMRVRFTGPIAASPFAYSLTYYFNNVQFATASINVPGPQRIPLDLEFKAQRALALPTGFPSGYTDEVTIELINTRTTSALT